MLIPQFKITQDDDFIIISIRLPYVKVTACEFYIQEKMFKFYLKPYLLTLNFEQPLKAVEQPAKAVYNHDKYVLTVYVQKQKKSQFFQNLHLLSNLLSNKKTQNTQKKPVRNLIQVMNQHKIDQNKGSHHVTKVLQTAQTFQQQNQYNYGFCANYSNVFKNLEEEVIQLFSFDPKDVINKQRFELEKKITYQEFDQDGYLYDKMSNFQEIQRIVQSNQTQKALKNLVKDLNCSDLDSEKFKSQMKIPKKEILIPKGQNANIWKQLFSLAFSYIYELICMQGQFGVQSTKTINKTNSVLSSNILYREQSLLQVVYDCCRRCVTYSLYKHLDICQKTLQVIRSNLSHQLMVAILMDLRYLFQKSQPRYLLNTIFLNDYCIYLMDGSRKQKDTQIKQFLIKHIKTLKLLQQEFQLDIQSQQMGSLLENDQQNYQDQNYQNQDNQVTKQTQKLNDDFEKLLDLD